MSDRREADFEPPCWECGLSPLECKCLECPTCKGKGTVDPLTAPAGHFCVGVDDCPTCDGTGEF